jgi:CDGSH-type Zn-finger protein
VSVDRDGPVLIEGPVEMVTDDGTVVTSDRFVVAVCTCRRSRTYPWCDTSHRRHKRPPAADAEDTESRRHGKDRGKRSEPEPAKKPQPEPESEENS